MLQTEKRVALATLDIGTSQIKLGVYCPFISDQIILINSLQNELLYGSSGQVTAEYYITREKCFSLFKELGSFLKTNQVEELNVGICGHVSSLIEWNMKTDRPSEDSFPIWLDTTSYNSLDEYNDVMGNGKSKQIIGTFLPTGTNWLFTKLLHRGKLGFNNESIFLQVGDAIFYELAAQYQTHFSSQISMVNLEKREYAPELLNHLQLPSSSLPTISYNPSAVKDDWKTLFDFPQQSFVFPAMADLYTSLHGLRLNDKEGFMLANTSEQAGAFYLQQPKVLDNFLGISFHPGFVNYGSTNTGGNVLGWFLNSVLNKKITAEVLDDLTSKAALIPPEQTPIILPYLQGERAPLWNSKLTASILELNSAHTETHLFRAILESISFARRQCFEEIGMDDLDVIKMAGGSSKNTLWNQIRATVLNKPVAVADEKELAMAGLINYIIECRENFIKKPAISFSVTQPNPAWTEIYNEKYARFIKYQKLLSE